MKIHAVFSREAVLKGSFDKYADSYKTKRGTAQVDDAFSRRDRRLARQFGAQPGFAKSGFDPARTQFFPS